MFNLRDFAKVIQGIRLVPATHLRDPNKLIRLWCHEVYRIFYDRLTDDQDRDMFFEQVKKHCQNEFKVIIRLFVTNAGKICKNFMSG